MNKTLLLNRLYQDINDIIISRQHPVTGLLPASTAITTHGDYTDAWVRDNVYSILSVWTLSRAFKRTGEKIKCDELSQSTIKLMRGLLQSMMRQSDKVETFKNTSNPLDCLHAKYSTTSGLSVVNDDQWGHLQIDATSIFLLMIAQMTATGLRIVQTVDEVDFVQNLVYYIAFAYRIPDYGIWERGNKINNGKTEINASSVGMAKAALQALDGFNVFGEGGNPKAIIHTIPDAISRARNTLTHLLPRESISKEVDSAILSIIGFPAFAVTDKKIVDKTKNKILSELGGEYGCKRFLWDGHQTSIEDHTRMHYEHSELASFENIESEWPLFYTYLYIQALFDDDTTEANKYRTKLESLMVEVDGKKLLPELYYVEKDNIAAEKENPGSQPRVPNENIPLVWAQSMYYTGLMLDEGLVTKDDLDPIKLRSRSTQNTDGQIALVVLAENNCVKEQLAKDGVIAETIDEIAPIKLMSADELVESYRKVGANSSLALTGRPKRRLQGLATAQTYVFNGQSYLSLSSNQHKENNYRVFDAKLASNHLNDEITHICKHWINDEVAVLTYLFTQDMCDSQNASELLDTICSFQLRKAQPNVGYASANLAIRASKVNDIVVSDINIKAFSNSAEISQSPWLTLDVSLLSDTLQQELKCFEISDEQGYEQLLHWSGVYKLSTLLADGDIVTEQGVSAFDYRTLVEALYIRAQHKQNWLTARLCFSVLNFSFNDLVDDIAQVCSRHISIGIGSENQLVLTGEHSLLKPDSLIELLDNVIIHPLERTLIQELLVILGNTIRINTQMFNGVRSIKLNNVLMLCANSSDYTHETLKKLSLKSPAELNDMVQEMLSVQQQAFAHDVGISFTEHNIDQTKPSTANAMDTDWIQWRSAKGLITRFDDEFLTDIWNSLANTRTLVFGDSKDSSEVLNSELIRASMTPREESFALTIDEQIQHLHPVYYKSAIVEVLYAYTQFCKANPNSSFAEVVLSDILYEAANIFVAEMNTVTANERSLDVLVTQSPQVLKEYALRVIEAL